MSALGLIETKGILASIEAADSMLKSANVCLLERVRVGADFVTVTVAGKDVSSVNAAVEAGTCAIKRLFPHAFVSSHVIARPDESLEQIIKLYSKNTENSGGTPPSSPSPSPSPSPSSSPSSLLPSSSVEKKVQSNTNDNKEIKNANNVQNSQAIVSDKSKKTNENSKNSTPNATSSKKTTTKSKDVVIPKISLNDSLPLIDVSLMKDKKSSKKKYTPGKLKAMSLHALRTLAKSIEDFSLSHRSIDIANKDKLINELLKFN